MCDFLYLFLLTYYTKCSTISMDKDSEWFHFRGHTKRKGK